ncbi:MAG: hypothetical protein JOZ65_27545 [Chloroflexi bacterium]|nr:hypothetical protein [Chloroflexota bacterium]
MLTLHSSDEWRTWLAQHADCEAEVWLAIAHKDTNGVHYGEAVEQALCFGWIDSHARAADAHSFMLRFTPRRAKSKWSKVNLQRAARMIELGLMTEKGKAAMVVVG